MTSAMMLGMDAYLRGDHQDSDSMRAVEVMERIYEFATANPSLEPILASDFRTLSGRRVRNIYVSTFGWMVT